MPEHSDYYYYIRYDVPHRVPNDMIWLIIKYLKKQLRTVTQMVHVYWILFRFKYPFL